MGKTTVITHTNTQKKRKRVTNFSLIHIFNIIKIKLKLEKYKAMYMYQIKELTYKYNMCYLKRKKTQRKVFFSTYKKLHIILERFTINNPQN